VRTLVFIPAWNEQASISAVIADVRQSLPDADILVVDDGSTDATTATARGCGSLVATLPFNQGLGAALQTSTPCARATTAAPTSTPTVSIRRPRLPACSR
jgi:glycosyltransferase involved in cell wall biosynthesis